MAVPAKDGAWVTATDVARIECSKCGVVEITRWPCHGRELDEKINAHLRESHRGRWSQWE